MMNSQETVWGNGKVRNTWRPLGTKIEGDG